MKARDLIRMAQRYCATLLREGANTWTAPDELQDGPDPDWQEERWRQAIRDIAETLERKAQGRIRTR